LRNLRSLHIQPPLKRNAKVGGSEDHRVRPGFVVVLVATPWLLLKTPPCGNKWCEELSFAQAKRSSRRPTYAPHFAQSALFNFQSFLTVLLLLICACTYLHRMPFTAKLLDNNKHGYVPTLPRGCPQRSSRLCDRLLPRFSGIFWKMARIGQRCASLPCSRPSFQQYVWCRRAA
jgi:hypothetical protein